MTKKILILSLLLLLFALPAFGQGTSTAPQAKPAATPPPAPKTHLKVGEAAPDFTLTDTEGNKVSLHDFKGKKNVVLAFYVLAFTGG